MKEVWQSSLWRTEEGEPCFWCVLLVWRRCFIHPADPSWAGNHMCSEESALVIGLIWAQGEWVDVVPW